jgi:hypothetical protein
MKNTIQTKARNALAATLVSLTALVGQTKADETNEVYQAKKPLIHDVFANTGWHSKYLGIYGFSITETPVIQSDVGFSVGKVNYDFWSNFDIKRNKITEVDNTLTTSFNIDKYTITPDAVHFNSPSGDFGDALELGLRVSRNDLPVNLSLFGANVFGKGIKAGQAFNLRAGKSFKLTERLTANIQTDLWYNNEYWCKGSGFSHVAVNGSLDYNLGNGVNLNAYAKAQKVIDNHGGTFKDDSAFGVSLTKKF